MSVVLSVVVGVGALVVAALYALIAVEIVPRLARIAREPTALIALARWGAFAFFMGCAATHVGIAVQMFTADPGGNVAMDHVAMGQQAGAGAVLHPAVSLVLVHGLPHLAQIVGGVAFITIARRHLDIRLTSKEVAARLEELEARFRASFERSPIGIALLAAHPANEGRFLQVNPALMAMLGYGSDHPWPDPHYRDLLSSEDHHGAVDMIALLQEEQEEMDLEQCYRHRLGHQVWVRVRTSRVRDSAGAVMFTLLQVSDITEQRRQEGMLRHLAEHDPLTGALNRRRFEEELDAVIARVERYGEPAALLIIDLDQFKYVNDTYGHLHGDDLLRRVADVIRARLRDTDLLARLGGDEFGVLCPQSSLEGGTTLAEGLMTALRRDAHVQVGARTVQVTASIGVAGITGKSRTATGRDGASADGPGLGGVGSVHRSGAELLAAADMAMYDSKENGRDRVTTVDASVQRPHAMKDRLAWSERIRDALAGDHFELWEQPIIDVRTGRPDHSELLVRMRDSATGTIIGPGVFLAAAERFGQVQAIDRWVFTQAVQVLAQRQARGSTATLEVNLSGASITDERLIDDLVAIIRSAPIDASRLMVEVTETAAIGNLEVARHLSGRLADLGCRFALDDFGSGFGSFAYLKHLPFDCVKIDGDFVRDLATSTSDQLTVQAIVTICHGLGKQTIAEYVQDESTMALLRGFGVDHAQGFYLALPRPVAEVLLPTPGVSRSR